MEQIAQARVFRAQLGAPDRPGIQARREQRCTLGHSRLAHAPIARLSLGTGPERAGFVS
jgi:hypothetical protein